MNKKYLIIGLCLLAASCLRAQTSRAVIINIKTLSDYELSHPEALKPCSTCGEKERDGGWKYLKDMLVPKGAIVKKQTPTVARPLSPDQPLSPSPIPSRSFLAYVDPGQTIPPDTHGAIGINHVVTATNDYLIVQTKTGTTLTTVSTNNFAGFSNTCDPYIQYDPVTQRWFYVAIECSSQNNNSVAILVSASSDPTGNWFRYSFIPSLPGGSFFLDHPYLGFDNRWLVISGRKFPASVNFSGPVLFLFDKANLINNGVINFGVNAQAIEKTSSDGDSPLPVTVFGSNPNPGSFYILQNWNAASSTIRLSTVTGNIPNASWNTSTAVFPSGGSSFVSSPGDIVEQSGESRRLATNDARISSGVMVNGRIWCAHHIGISSTNVAVQWWQLNGTAGSSFGNILQRGRIGDGLPNNYRWFPSIAVNSSEEVIIGYTVSSDISSVSSAYSFRTNTTPANTTLEENIYKVGLSRYYKTFGGTRARWGDYSHSAIDPVDESLWTVQEYADQRTGGFDDNSRYGVWWAQVLPVSTLVQRDAGIGAIIEPVPGLLCNPTIHPSVTIRNFGKDTLKSVQVGMLLDDVQVGTTKLLTNLSLGSLASSAPLTLNPDVTPAAGLHTLKVYTISPNGSTDLKTSNDTLALVFTIAPLLSLPYTESFEGNIFPPSNGSAIINENNGSVTWTRTATTGNPGAASILFNGFSNGGVGQRDIYRLPQINAAILDSVVMNFNVAYKEFTGASDSLVVVYSPDCGTSWLPAGYAKGGARLSTSPGTTIAGFIPTATEWRNEHLVLKNFCAADLKTMMIGFMAVSGGGNNIYVDGITVTAFESPHRNIGLTEIFSPVPALCLNSFTPAIRFTNFGMDTVSSLQINYQVDDGVVTTSNWTGKLAKCSEAVVTLASATSATGTHTLKIFTSSLNGLGDEFTGNDTLRKTFTIYNTTPLETPVAEGFETTIIPQNNWGIQNPDGLKTWERTTAASKKGNASLWINNPAVENSTSATDHFISPIVAYNPSIDSLFVSWDYAYETAATYPGSSFFPQDTFELSITKDCGQSFTSIWKKWGTDLQTIVDPNNSGSNLFMPGKASEWKTGRVYLTPIVGTSSFQVYFTARSNKQNNLWLDNINISSKTLPQRLKQQGYLVYPNPFLNSFLVHHVYPPADLQAIQLFNAAGQLMAEKRFNGNATTEEYIRTGNIAKGLYILKMIYSGKTIVERIIKN